MVMGFSCPVKTTDCVTITHPHPSPPLEREGTFSGAPTSIDTYAVKRKALKAQIFSIKTKVGAFGIRFGMMVNVF